MAGQCVCISGSTQGIGYGIALAFAKAGARLVINSHQMDREALERLEQLCECHFVQADLSSVAGARGFIAQAHEKLGLLDVLVNNAGTFKDTDFEQISEENYDACFNLNVKGYLFAAQEFASKIPPGQTGASIICVGSTNSMAAERNSVIYDASKGAVLMMMRSLAVTLAGRGIRVNGIGPGIIETPLTLPGLEREGARETLNSKIPLGRIGQAQDIGGAAVFLASDAASYITGQMMFIDGGILANQSSWEPTA